MKYEAIMRRTMLAVAAVCWAASLTLSWLILDKVISTVDHPGISLIVFMAQGIAITATIVWAQFRNRRVMLEVLRTGVKIGQDEE